MPLFLMLLNDLFLIGKLLLLMLIFSYFLLLSLYEIYYNNQHVILKDNDEYQIENAKNEILTEFKRKKSIKYFIKKIIDFIPVYLGFFGLIANIVISYITLSYLYAQPFSKIIIATNRNGIWIFFTSYNYIHVILHNFFMLLFLMWLM